MANPAEQIPALRRILPEDRLTWILLKITKKMLEMALESTTQPITHELIRQELGQIAYLVKRLEKDA